MGVRAGFGPWVLATYVVGAVLLPMTHIAFHRDDHDHRGGGLHDHVHADDDHASEEASAPAEHDSDHHDHENAPASDHGDRSLLHFSVALSDAPASFGGLYVCQRTTPVMDRRTGREFAARPLTPHQLRGPPRSLLFA